MLDILPLSLMFNQSHLRGHGGTVDALQAGTKNAPKTWSDLVRHTKKKPEQHESGVDDGADMINEEQESAPHDEPMDSVPNREDDLDGPFEGP